MKNWWSAEELAKMSVFGGARAIQIRAQKEKWDVRSRGVRGRGGGKEYHYSSLPERAQVALALHWYRTETEAGREALRKAKEGDPLSAQRWEAYSRLPNSQKPRLSAA